MTVHTVRIPKELAERLDQLSKATKRSKSSFIIEALETHLTEQEDLEIALARFRDPTTQWVGHDEVKRELDLD